MTLKDVLDLLSKEKVTEDIEVEIHLFEQYRFDIVDVHYEGRGPKLIITLTEA